MIQRDIAKNVDGQLGASIRDAEHQQANPDQAIQVASLFGWAGNIFSKMNPKIRTGKVVDNFNTNKGNVRSPSKDDIDAMLGDIEAEQGHTMAGTEDELAPIGPTPPEIPETGLHVEPDGPAKLFDEAMKTEVPTEKITGARNINIERHHQGAAANRDRLLADLPADVALHQMETADDVGRLLEAAGKVQDMGDDVRTHGTLAAQTDSPAKVKRILSDVFAADKSVMSNLTDVQLLAGRKMLGSLGEEVAELSNRIVAGSTEPQTLMEYQKKGEAFLALQSFLQGKVRETARALAQQRMIAETLESSNIANINDFMAQGTGLRTPEDIIRHATLTKNHIDKQGAEAGTVEGLKPQMRDYFKVGVEYWANNILSGVETHLVNLLGSPTVQLYEGLFIRPIAHGIGLARHTFDMGRPKPPGPHATLDEVERFNRGTVAWNERIKMQEHTSRLAGFTIGMRDGLTAFFDAIKTGKTQFGPEKGEEVRGAMHKVFGYHFGEKGEKAAALASGSFRALGAEDGFWKTNIFRSEFTALAARDAYAKNLDVDEHIEKVLSNPADFPELYEQAMSYSRKYTFTETDRPGILGDVARSAKGILSKHPYLKFIMPFVDTPTNLLHYAAENSALAPLSKELQEEMAKGGARADIAQARVVAGLALTTTAYTLWDQGMITGAGPDSWEEKKLREMTGWQGESLYIGGEYYGVSRADPFAMTVFAIVSEIESAKYAKEERGFAESFVSGTLKVGQHALDATFMRGMNDFLNVLQGRKGVKKWLANFAPGFIPYSNLMKTTSKLVDPQPRAIYDDKNFESTWSYLVKKKAMQVIPGMSKNIAPARYWDGSLKHPKNGVPVNKMTIMDKVENAMAPVKSSKPQKRDLATENLIENGIAPGPPPPMMTLHKVEFSLLTLDNADGKLYDAYITEVGKKRREAVMAVIKDSGWKTLDAGRGSDRAAMLQRAINSAIKPARAVFLNEILPRYVLNNIEKAPILAKMLSIDPGDLIERARRGLITDPAILDKINVKGVADRGQLPVPLHVEEQREQPLLPKF